MLLELEVDERVVATRYYREAGQHEYREKRNIYTGIHDSHYAFVGGNDGWRRKLNLAGGHHGIALFRCSDDLAPRLAFSPSLNFFAEVRCPRE